MVSFPPPVRSLELLAYRDRMPVEVLGTGGGLVPPTDWGSVPATACTRIRVDRPPLDEFLAEVRVAGGLESGSGGGQSGDDPGGKLPPSDGAVRLVDMD